MPIAITRTGDLFSATVSPPHGNGTLWSSPEATTASNLIDALCALGCHTTDITDAFYEADPLWTNRLKGPELGTQRGREAIASTVENTVVPKVDLLVKTSEGNCKLVLVEVGPWPPEEEDQNLHRLGQRIRDCISAVINGVVAERYPEFAGKRVWIEVNSYSTPRWGVEALVAKLQNMVNTNPEIQQELKQGRYTSSILISHRWKDFEEEYRRREAARKSGLWHRLKKLVSSGR